MGGRQDGEVTDGRAAETSLSQTDLIRMVLVPGQPHTVKKCTVATLLGGATPAEVGKAADISARGPVVMTDAASYSILAANSGLLHVISDMTQNSAFDLPTPAAGLEYEFIYGGVVADAHDHTLDTGSDTNFFIGALLHHVPTTDATTDIPSDNNSNSILTLTNCGIGTRFKVWCDGTNWYIAGTTVGEDASAFSDQP